MTKLVMAEKPSVGMTLANVIGAKKRQEEFEHYCLRPAMEMRGVIKKQLCIIDPKEFDVPGKRDIPEITYNS